jgi:hypothetical protein
MVPPA